MSRSVAEALPLEPHRLRWLVYFICLSYLAAFAGFAGEGKPSVPSSGFQGLISFVEVFQTFDFKPMKHEIVRDSSRRDYDLVTFLADAAGGLVGFGSAAKGRYDEAVGTVGLRP